jgi:hypothetical protein
MRGAWKEMGHGVEVFFLLWLMKEFEYIVCVYDAERFETVEHECIE